MTFPGLWLRAWLSVALFAASIPAYGSSRGTAGQERPISRSEAEAVDAATPSKEGLLFRSTLRDDLQAIRPVLSMAKWDSLEGAREIFREQKPITALPEPGSVVFFVTGLLAVICLSRSRRAPRMESIVN